MLVRHSPRADARVAVAVVGGGVTGLTAAYRLAREGVDVALFERAARCGGVIATHRADGYVVEEGPMTVLPAPSLRALVHDLGLDGALLTPRPTCRRRYVARDGRLHAVPASPTQFLASGLLSTRAKLRLLAEPLRAPRENDTESAADFAARRFGPEVRDYVVAPFLQGMFAGDAARLGAPHALRRLVAFERSDGSVVRGALAARRRSRGAGAAPAAPTPVSFPRGLGTLVQALRDALGARVTCGASLESLDHVDGAWRLELRVHGETRIVIADGLVLALPAPALAALDVPPAMQAALAPIMEIEHASIATLSFAFHRADVAHALDGFGVLLPPVERRRLLGVLFASSLFDGRCPPDQVLVTCFVGGTRHPDLAAQPTRELVAVARAELAELLGTDGTPLYVHHAAHRDAIPQYGVAHDAVLAAADAIEARWPRLVLAGAWRHGIAVGDCIAAGDRAAARLASGALHADASLDHALSAP